LPSEGSNVVPTPQDPRMTALYQDLFSLEDLDFFLDYEKEAEN